MFHLIATPAGPQWRCTLLEACGVEHGFTTRQQRIAPGETGRRVIAGLAGVEVDRVTLSKQTHGNRVTVNLSPADVGDCEADAHVTRRRGSVVAVRTADCVPILMSDEAGSVVAAVHAGWRGLGVGVIGEAAAAMRGDASADGQLIAAVGPCISIEHYEVGEEVAGLFRRQTPHAVREPDGGPGVRPHLDLRAVAVAQLRGAGVQASDIAVHPGCTYREAEGFHSYRREGPGCGHMAAWVRKGRGVDCDQ